MDGLLHQRDRRSRSALPARILQDIHNRLHRTCDALRQRTHFFLCFFVSLCRQTYPGSLGSFEASVRTGEYVPHEYTFLRRRFFRNAYLPFRDKCIDICPSVRPHSARDVTRHPRADEFVRCTPGAGAPRCARGWVRMYRNRVLRVLVGASIPKSADARLFDALTNLNAKHKEK